jgi:DNA-binding transcriptional ArsR family regulator
MLEQVFASRTRAGLMEVLLGPDEGELSTRELIRRVGTGASSVQRELGRLERAGIVRSRRIGNARVFSADPSHALHSQLRALVIASFEQKGSQ